MERAAGLFNGYGPGCTITMTMEMPPGTQAAIRLAVAHVLDDRRIGVPGSLATGYLRIVQAGYPDLRTASGNGQPYLGEIFQR